MDIGIVGAANRGKSTLFSAVTQSQAEIASYPFTTVKANVAVGYATTKCPCKELNVKCAPKSSKCVNGTRLLPIKMIDVAGLVPGAHEGRGMGNQFMDDLRQASALIQVIDLSGSADEEGQSCGQGEYDPAKDISFLKEEIDLWFYGIIKKQWEKVARKIQSQHEDFYHFMGEQLAGLGVTEGSIRKAVKEFNLDPTKPADWSDDQLKQFSAKVRAIGKPIIIAGNKSDMPNAKENFERIKKEFPDLLIEPCCAEAELALRRAAEHKLIEYIPGASDFKIVGEMDEKHQKALEFIREKVLKIYGSTGIQKLIDEAVYNLLGQIVVYPVEDEHKLSDKNGNVLPDAYLVRKGSTCLDVAFKVHTDIGEHFIAAIDAKTHRKLGKDHAVNSGDIIKIVAKT